LVGVLHFNQATALRWDQIVQIGFDERRAIRAAEGCGHLSGMRGFDRSIFAEEIAVDAADGYASALGQIDLVDVMLLHQVRKCGSEQLRACRGGHGLILIVPTPLSSRTSTGTRIRRRPTPQEGKRRRPERGWRPGKRQPEPSTKLSREKLSPTDNENRSAGSSSRESSALGFSTTTRPVTGSASEPKQARGSTAWTGSL